MSEEPDQGFNIAVDVVVVGGGLAGFAAAVTAASQGASVVLLEREQFVGGTTLLSGGTCWIPNNSYMRANGLADPRDQAMRFLCRLAYPHLYDVDSPTLGLGTSEYELIATFYDRGTEAIDYLAALGAMEPYFDGVQTDYHAHLAENKAPVGRRVPHRGGSAALFEHMQSVADRFGVQVLTGHRVVAALRDDDGAVFGVEAHAGRQVKLVRAHRAVVFASGGFVHNEELVRRYVPGRLFGACAAPGATGDFVTIGQEAGAALGNMNRAWWKQVPVEAALRDRHILGYFNCNGDSMIQVNKYGRRVVNEKAPYNERGQIHHYWDPSAREYPNLLLFMIWDDIVHGDPARTPANYLSRAEDVVTAGTFEDLAAGLSERLDALSEHSGGLRLAPGFTATLRETIDRFGDFARKGVDEDFQRGESPIDIKGPWGTAVAREGLHNPTLAPFAERGPYHAVIVGAGALDTVGGPRINARAQVLDARDRPVPGLYGAGNCVSSITGQAYWGPGGTLGPAVCFGYIAGLNAVQEKMKSTGTMALAEPTWAEQRRRPWPCIPWASNGGAKSATS